MNRGEIWWANLPDPRGSEAGYRRPVIIISSDAFNRSLIKTVLAVVVSSNLRLAQAPGNVMLLSKETGLMKDSVANVSQVITIDKGFLSACAGIVPTKLLKRIEVGLRLAMDL
ncbi:MAG: type II toxin-antitoxin system PemK/MazF family toxin [Planctomycetota bacterium]|jgi:mRNA interferase MazF